VARARAGPPKSTKDVGHYTILLLSILLGVWHTKKGDRGGGSRILRSSRTIVLGFTLHPRVNPRCSIYICMEHTYTHISVYLSMYLFIYICIYI